MKLYGDTAAAYRDFAAYTREASPCFAAWSSGVADDPDMVEWIDALPPVKRQPNLVFAAARWHGVPSPGPYAGLRARLLGDDGTVRATILHRATQTNEVGRLATLVPVMATLGPRLSLVEAGASAGLCLYPDRHRYRWATDDGGVVEAGTGPPLECRVRGAVPLPAEVPAVAWRGGVDVAPVDLHDDDAVRWLENLVWPEDDARRDRLRAAIAQARREPGRVEKADAREALPEMVTRAAEAGAPVVVFHSAVVAYMAPAVRDEFAALMTGLVDAGACHWISNEGPDVLPGVTATAPRPPPQGFFVTALDGRAVAWSRGHGGEMRAVEDA